MKRPLLPAPLLTAALIAMWLLLNRSLSAGQWLLAVAFGIAAPWLVAPLRPGRVSVRRPLVLARLVARVGIDVVRSNIEVFTTLLRSRRHPPRSRFVTVPLDVRDVNALAALAVVTTVVPGTVWCELARDGSALLLHVWNAPDEGAFIAHYKRAYEGPLMQIFETP